jgi:hypothetical protein
VVAALEVAGLVVAGLAVVEEVAGVTALELEEVAGRAVALLAGLVVVVVVVVAGRAVVVVVLGLVEVAGRAVLLAGLVVVVDGRGYWPEQRSPALSDSCCSLCSAAHRPS